MDDHTTKGATRRVLIYRLGSLGDTVIALPALHLVRKTFPDAERRMLTSFPPNAKAPASSAVLDGTGLIHGYMHYAYETRSLAQLAKLWWQIMRWRPQVLIYMNSERPLASVRRDVKFFRLCGIRQIIGAPVSREMEHGQTKASPEEAQLRNLTLFEPECARLTRNLGALGQVSLDDPCSWDLALTGTERARATDVLYPLGTLPFFAVSLGTKNQSNDWTVSNWRALLSQMAVRYPDYALAICGAAPEREMSELVASAWREAGLGPAVNLCGSLRPRESAAVFERASVFLGHDSGPIHLASAVQTPCVGIYGARNMPGIWFPFGKKHQVIYNEVECAGCRLQECLVEKKKCILSISPEDVLATLAKILPPTTPVAMI